MAPAEAQPRRSAAPRGPCLLLLAACAVCSCADDSPPPAQPPRGACEAAPGEAAQAILRGEVDQGDPAVVAVNTLDVDCQRAGAPACTGTLVGPDLVLTAAHCLGQYPPEFFGVLLGTNADPGRGELGAGLDGAFFRVEGIRMHPQFDPETLANDVALLRLAEAAPAPPAALPDGPLSAPLAGAEARVVGFGQADEAPAFAKREGTVEVTEASAAELVYGSLPSMTCAGDSGGPVLMMIDGSERIVGVTSRGDAACADHGIAIRVDSLPQSFFEEAW